MTFLRPGFQPSFSILTPEPSPETMLDDDLTSYKKLPLYQKAEEIFEVVKQIAELIPEDDDALQITKEHILSDSMMIMAKIAGAEAGELYDIKMENAAIIRKSARDLKVQYHSLAMFGFEEVEYFHIVRNLIEEFRLLFIDWVAAFDKEDYVIDRWGLFNPPGVGPFDKDPDEDIPFDPEDEF